MMGYCDDFDLPVTDPIDQTERKVWKEIPPRSVHIQWPALRCLTNALHAGV
jgi:hypothetical protein